MMIPGWSCSNICAARPASPLPLSPLLKKRAVSSRSSPRQRALPLLQRACRWPNRASLCKLSSTICASRLESLLFPFLQTNDAVVSCMPLLVAARKLRQSHPQPPGAALLPLLLPTPLPNSGNACNGYGKSSSQPFRLPPQLHPLPLLQTLLKASLVTSLPTKKAKRAGNNSAPKTTGGPGRAPPWPGPGMESLGFCF